MDCVQYLLWPEYFLYDVLSGMLALWIEMRVGIVDAIVCIHPARRRIIYGNLLKNLHVLI
jgi:hypothetical protein